MTKAAHKQNTSRPETSPRDLEVIIATAAAYARKLSRALRLSRDDEKDAEQDILLTLLERWHYFDGTRGRNIGFAIRIARQALQSVASRILADRELETVGVDYCLDVDDPSAELEALTVADTLADEAALTETMILEALAVGLFLERLPQDYALVAYAIREVDGDLAEAQRLTELSVTEFYRRLRELRYRFVCLELAPRQWLSRP